MTDAELAVHESRPAFVALKAAAEALFEARDAATADPATAVRHMRTVATQMATAEAAMDGAGSAGWAMQRYLDRIDDDGQRMAWLGWLKAGAGGVLPGAGSDDVQVGLAVLGGVHEEMCAEYGARYLRRG
ncbi:hypothetical protein FHR90_003325 [Endobacter medicaginis]|nr:hypothetical protein [Endobacter medicaginis]MBB3175469.1 hypothetical protein [Endobacter medicaginis]MCX5477139.1 hypothetical protein [Endobacter medicaginis]